MPLQKTDPNLAREIICVYGQPTSGKTRLVTSLPERFGKMVYFAIDEGGEGLVSVLTPYKERIETYRLDGKDPKLGVGRDLFDIYTTDWAKQGFKTIIIDTISRLTYTVLDLVTSEKVQMVRQAAGRRIGEPGEPGFIALPDEGHYGAMSAVMLKFVSFLTRLQPDMNIIFVCHEQPADERSPLGGPGFAGRAVGKWLPGFCQNAVIRVTRTEKSSIDKSGGVDKVVKRIAWVAPHGTWIARRAESTISKTPLERVELDPDPINFWLKMDAEKNGE